MTSCNVASHVAENAYQFLEDESLYNTLWTTENMQMDILSWAEYGLNYGLIMFQNKKHLFKGGINLKVVDGFAAGYVKNADVTYNILSADTILFGPTSLDYGRTDFNSLIRQKTIKTLSMAVALAGTWDLPMNCCVILPNGLMKWISTGGQTLIKTSIHFVLGHR